MWLAHPIPDNPMDFLPFNIPPQRNLDCMFLIVFHTNLGALKKDISNKGNVVITDLIKKGLPVIDSNLPFHIESLDSML